MRLSQNEFQTSESFFEEELYQGQIDLLRYSVVKLQGVVHNNQTFTGTGVLCRVDSNKCYILTAKHNLHVARGNGSEDLSDYFRQKIQVFLDVPSGNVPTTGTISAITFPDGREDDNRLDLAVLRIDSLPFADKARTFLTAGPKSTAWSYASTEWRESRAAPDPKKPFFELLSLANARTVLNDGHDIYDANYVEADSQHWTLVQYGHGKGHTDANAFTRRALPITGLASPTYIATTNEGYQNVFTFATNRDNTSREGDSGGPIFAISADGKHIALLGINLGANYYADRTDDSNGISNNAFTVVATDNLANQI